jgi:hypothetical protein
LWERVRERGVFGANTTSAIYLLLTPIVKFNNADVVKKLFFDTLVYLIHKFKLRKARHSILAALNSVEDRIHLGVPILSGRE